MASKQSKYFNDFSEVQIKEKEWINRRRKSVEIAEDSPLIGLALSGGGIRSATFNLGVIESLSQRGLMAEVDYLSTVSGGGYIGSCYSWVRTQRPEKQGHPFTDTEVQGSSDRKKECNEKETLVEWLRAHGDYLIAGKGFSLWQLMASILAGTILNLFVMLPVFIWTIALLCKEFISMDWPHWLHLAGLNPMQEHDGFLLFLLLGVFSFAGYIVSIFVFALSTASPFFSSLSRHYFFRKLMGRLLGFSIIAIGIGLIPIIGSFDHWLKSVLDNESAESWGRHLSYLIPLLSGVGALWQARRKNNNGESGSLFAKLGIALLAYSFFVLIYHLVNHTSLMDGTYIYWWTGVSLLLAVVVNVNAISMHSYYRGRLSLAYLPKLKQNKDTADVTNSDSSMAESSNAGNMPKVIAKTEPMDFELSALSPDYGAPFHIINTTMNCSSSALQKLRSRKGENFFLSPYFCGSTHTGYRRTAEFGSHNIALSTAFSVSGAAVDPNTYATASRPIAFLMALFNFRLGYWTDNPKYQRNGGLSPSWYRLMLREMLGVKLDEDQKQIHLSDGGHFENLGVYELLRRRVPYIIVCDAGADPDGKYSDLGKAIQRSRADFDVEIEIDLTDTTKPIEWSDSCRCQIGTIHYPATMNSEKTTGKLLYLKAALMSPLSADIYAYWKQNGQFPDQSTADQFFDELQFDAYRQLGSQLMGQLIDGKKSLREVIE